MNIDHISKVPALPRRSGRQEITSVCTTAVAALSFIMLVAVTPLAVPQAYAQERGVLEEVVVTAQRREQSLQDVPISVSVFSGDALERQNIKDAQSYLSITPNVVFSEETQNGERGLSISIRGVNNISVLENRGGGSAIGYYYDEVSLGAVSQGTANPQLLDIERIEVLRGPQGTFFGLSATGGALNIITRSPNAERYGELNAEVGNHQQWAASGIYNLPVTDSFFLRGVISVEETPAVVQNVNEVGGDSGSFNQLYRLGARFEATDRLSFEAKVDYMEEEQDLEAVVGTCRLDVSSQNLMSLDAGVREFGFPRPIPVGIDGAIDDGLGCFPDNISRINKSTYVNGGRDTEWISNDSLIFRGKVSFDAEAFTVDAITGYVDTQSQTRLDLDAVNGRYVNRQNNDTTDAWSQEIRFSGSGEHFNWIVGGFYFESDQTRRNLISADEDRFFVFQPLSTLNQFFQTTNIETFAVFADFSYYITDRVTLTAGGRYSENSIEQCAQNLSPGAQIPFTCAGDADTDDFSPRFSVSYDWSDDVTTYLTASRGYKPGGSQVEGTQALGSYQPSFFDKETLWNYELGIKASLLDDRLRINAAVYYMDWEDLQVDDTAFTVNPETNRTETSTFIRSADQATSKGFEVEFAALLTSNLTLGGGVGYTDATFDDFADTARPQGRGPIDLTGQAIPGAVEWTVNAYSEYGFTVADMDAYVRAEYLYRDEFVPNLNGYFYLITDPALLGFIENDGNTFPFVVPSYQVVNLRAGVEVTNWRIITYVENVFEEDYYTGARFGFRLNGVNVRPNPRQYGIKATYTWH